MPYRAMIWTVVTIGLALVAVGLWLRAVEPMFAHVEADEVATTNVYAANPTTAESPQKMMKSLVQGTMLLSFLLICLVLVVGLGATFREWVKYGAGGRRISGKKPKTQYVDVWKIAGERMKVEGGKKPEDPDASDEDDGPSKL